VFYIHIVEFQRAALLRAFLASILRAILRGATLIATLGTNKRCFVSPMVSQYISTAPMLAPKGALARAAPMARCCDVLAHK
jgi:hypothetical protein